MKTEQEYIDEMNLDKEALLAAAKVMSNWGYPKLSQALINTANGKPPAEPKPSFTKKSLLEAAISATADRGLNYGKPEDNFSRIAKHWTCYLKNRIQPEEGEHVVTSTDVAVMMALMKIARLENDPRHADSWVDLAGYAACGAEIALPPDEAKA